MSKLYEVECDYENYSSFHELYDHVNNRFCRKYWDWKNIDLNTYEPVRFELLPSENGKLNYKFDITKKSNLIILSEKAVGCLKDVLEPLGQFIPIITPSKRKKFVGFYPNKNVYDNSIINFEKSNWRQAEKGKIFSTIRLNSKYPKNDYIFVLEEEPINIFITDKFKELVEKYDLKGLDFSSPCKIED